MCETENDAAAATSQHQRRYDHQLCPPPPPVRPRPLSSDSHPVSETQYTDCELDAFDLLVLAFKPFQHFVSFSSGRLNPKSFWLFMSLSLCSRGRDVSVWDSACGRALCLWPAATSLYGNYYYNESQWYIFKRAPSWRDYVRRWIRGHLVIGSLFLLAVYVCVEVDGYEFCDKQATTHSSIHSLNPHWDQVSSKYWYEMQMTRPSDQGGIRLLHV